MGQRLEDVLAGFRQQLQEIDEALTPLEQQLGVSTLSPTQRTALQRRLGRLKHGRDVLIALVEDLQGQINRRG